MTIGNDLDQAFYNITQRLTRLEGNNNESVLDIEADLTAQIEELQERMSDSDLDDLRCDLESQIESLQDSITYESDRIDEIDCYKMTEEEVEYLVDNKMDDRFNEAMDSVLEDLDLNSLLARVAELESRLNKPTLGARVLRWLREGPSVKQIATGWYAGMRRGS